MESWFNIFGRLNFNLNIFSGCFNIFSGCFPRKEKTSVRTYPLLKSIYYIPHIFNRVKNDQSPDSTNKSTLFLASFKRLNLLYAIFSHRFKILKTKIILNFYKKAANLTSLRKR